MEISKITVNGTTYDIKDTITSINGKTGAIAASDIVSVLTAAGYELIEIQNKPAVVSDILYDSATNKLQKTINGTISDVVTIISGGFLITINETTGIDTLSAIGGASITYNTSTGIDSFAF